MDILEMFQFPSDKDWTIQIEALKSFLNCWYDEIKDEDGISSEILDNLKVELPKPLRMFFEFAGNKKEVMGSQNDFVEPMKIKEDLIFYVESQRVYVWATDNHEDNPKVYGQIPSEEDGWQIEGERLSAFLYEICLFEAIIGAPFMVWNAWVPIIELEDVLTNWKTVPYKPWRWPGYPTTYHHTDNALAVVTLGNIRGDKGASFYFGAKKPEDILFMKKFESENWEWGELKEY